MPDTRAAKRARVDDEPNADVVIVESEENPKERLEEKEEDTLKRSAFVWLSDGNIVLQAGEKVFRVHKSILSMHSTVFEDMFKVPQPLPTPESTYDGCPLVKVDGDDWGHWEWLLSLLYDGRREYATGDSFQYDLVESLITLGDKYDFKHLKDDALKQFKATFPQRFHMVSSAEFPKGGFYMDEGYASNICDIVALAQRFKIQTSLPAIYFHILVQEDFPAALHAGVGGKFFEPETEAVLYRGRERIFQGMSKHQFRWLWPDQEVIPCVTCTRQGTCRKALDVIQGRLWRPVPKVIRALEPFHETFTAGGLCKHCTATVELNFLKGQQEFWKELPTYFDLPPWSELGSGPD